MSSAANTSYDVSVAGDTVGSAQPCHQSSGNQVVAWFVQRFN
jgi:hypothetical protein